MTYYIAEDDRGLTVAEIVPGLSVEQSAAQQGQTVVDPGPFSDFEMACDALESLQWELEGDDSDTPGARALESREDAAD